MTEDRLQSRMSLYGTQIHSAIKEWLLYHNFNNPSERNTRGKSFYVFYNASYQVLPILNY